MRILVIGSTNTDMVVTTGRFPKPGETLMGDGFFLFPGGKGANQAVAAARLGAEVTFITSLGDDLFGRQALDGLASEGIRTEHSLIRSGVASGVAVITVNKEGENTIVVAPGANDKLTMDHVGPQETVVKYSDLILMQLEIPMETVEGSIRMAASMGKRVILNPAPARPLPAAILKGLFAITPNETEAEALTGIKVKDPVTAANAGSALLAMGVTNVIITMGSSGAFFMDGHTRFMVPADQVKAVDTTAAGDVFNGALAVAISEGLDWHDAIAFANRAAGIAVTRMGAQTSAPFRNEIKG
jgi:ribokinase